MRFGSVLQHLASPRTTGKICGLANRGICPSSPSRQAHDRIVVQLRSANFQKTSENSSNIMRTIQKHLPNSSTEGQLCTHAKHRLIELPEEVARPRPHVLGL